MNSTRLTALTLAAVSMGLSAQALAVPGGEIGTLSKGDYQCELPGSATGPSRQRVPEKDFRIISASSYMAGEKRGIYLLTGDAVVMTSGPMNGQRFHRTSSGFLRGVDANGQDTSFRCILVTRNNT